ncbi:MAG: recombinase family protein, partial [Ruminococcus sp.]|nr:recombinase family protein [Ruminococcus sp.]
VAGYARVSTEQEEQQTSYAAQVDYYTKYIKKHSEWEFVKVYTDEGISATNTKHRDGFNQMIADALDGKIDLIITKSVSRFARNTVDSLSTIRKLKEKNVECFFEKEGIWTFDGKGELLISIMSSLAQEESRSISENVTWGHRKRMQDGKVSLPYSSFLGYKKGEDGLPEIVPEEAETIRFIYKSYMEGQTTYTIAKALTERKIPTPTGKEKWHQSTIKSILTNEKYKGSALLQKKFTTDFLTKKVKVNEGEVPQYWIEESHPAIISPEDFEQVQLEMARRKKLGKQYSGNSLFAAKIVCADCGCFFGSKVWHSTSKYRRVIWQCNNKFKGQQLCSTSHLYEDEIKQRFVNAFSVFFQGKDMILETVQMLIESLSDTSAINKKIEKLAQELSVIENMNRELVIELAQSEKPHDDYDERRDALTKEYDEKFGKFQKLEQKRIDQLN